VGSSVSGFVRGWIFAAALAQAALPGVVGIIDASEAGSAVVAAMRPHAEDQSAHHGRRVHQEDNCALCQFVSGTVAPAADAVQPALLRSKPLEIVRGHALLPEWLTDGSPSLPRAPPTQA
jgi:hypothetical protein